MGLTLANGADNDSLSASPKSSRVSVYAEGIQAGNLRAGRSFKLGLQPFPARARLVLPWAQVADDGADGDQV